MTLPSWLTTLCLALFMAGRTVPALELDVDDEESIKHAAATTAFNMMSNYHGNESGQVPGKLAETWWEGGAMFMGLIQYWYWTGDTSYNPVTSQGMYWQKGSDNDYFPSNYSNYLGNDDQVFWGLAAMTASELNYPEDEGQPSWLSLAQGVFNTQVPRWETSDCGGGLRWQIFPYQEGYVIKNSVSNGGLFQLAARLARYTNNQTYAEWAEKIWDWSATTPLLQKNSWFVADTTTIQKQCKDAGNIQWTYNYGMYLNGAAYMYNLTSDSKWKDGVDGLLDSTMETFFPKKFGGKIMSEVACEPNMMCDRNQDCFKGFLSTWLTFMTTIVPYTADRIIPKIQASAKAAAKQCSGGKSGSACGRRWYQSKWDGSTSLEADMSALNIISSAMITHKNSGGGGGGSGGDSGGTGPLTSDTGGKSEGNPNAGTSSEGDSSSTEKLEPITTGDRAGAGIATVVFVGSWLGMMAWMVSGGEVKSGFWL